MSSKVTSTLMLGVRWMLVALCRPVAMRNNLEGRGFGRISHVAIYLEPNRAEPYARRPSHWGPAPSAPWLAEPNAGEWRVGGRLAGAPDGRNPRRMRREEAALPWRRVPRYATIVSGRKGARGVRG